MRLFLHELRNQQLVFWRSKEAALFIFLFPLLLFVLLGYGCANTAFAGLAIQLVVRRELGIMKRLRATPLSATTYIAATLASTLIVFVLQVIALFALGRLFYGTPFPHALGSLVLAIVIGAAAFAALGVASASLIHSAEGSSAVVNFILLPMAFLTGSFGPTRHYPSFLRAIGDVLPLKYFIDIMNAVYLHRQALWTKPGALGVLAAWGATGLLVSALKFRWEPHGG